MEGGNFSARRPGTRREERSAIGEFTDFHNAYGCYAEGINPEVAILPSGWMDRVNKIQNENTNGGAGYCLDVTDLFLAKAAAGRDKDREFCVALIPYGYVAMQNALDRVPLRRYPGRAGGATPGTRAMSPWAGRCVR